MGEGVGEDRQQHPIKWQMNIPREKIDGEKNVLHRKITSPPLKRNQPCDRPTDQ